MGKLTCRVTNRVRQEQILSLVLNLQDRAKYAEKLGELVTKYGGVLDPNYICADRFIWTQLTGFYKVFLENEFDVGEASEYAALNLFAVCFPDKVSVCKRDIDAQSTPSG